MKTGAISGVKISPGFTPARAAPIRSASPFCASLIFAPLFDFSSGGAESSAFLRSWSYFSMRTLKSPRTRASGLDSNFSWACTVEPETARANMIRTVEIFFTLVSP